MITSPFSALESENQFLLEPTDLFDSLPSFPGDTGIGDGGTDGTTGSIGGSPGFPPGSPPFTLLLDGDFDQFPPGNTSGLQSLDDPNLAVVPEPGSFFLLATGLVLAARRFRRH